MFRSLHRKLVLILVLLIVSVMAVVGTFLINSINTFYRNASKTRRNGRIHFGARFLQIKSYL